MDEKTEPSKGRAIPLVTYQNKKFVLDLEAEELLKNSIYKNIGIISLVGKYRTGKSFLLNRVLLNQKKLGFDVGPTIRPCTKVYNLYFNKREYGYGQSRSKWRTIIQQRSSLCS